MKWSLLFNYFLLDILHGHVPCIPKRSLLNILRLLWNFDYAAIGAGEGLNRFVIDEWDVLLQKRKTCVFNCCSVCHAVLKLSSNKKQEFWQINGNLPQQLPAEFQSWPIRRLGPTLVWRLGFPHNSRRRRQRRGRMPESTTNVYPI